MALVDVIIGYAKGAQGDVGPQGPQGEIGPAGPQGSLPPLVNSALATEAGVAALDAAMGKTLQDQITEQNSNLSDINSKTPTDLNYIYAFIPRIADFIGTGQSANLLNEITYIISTKGIRSGAFGYSNRVYTDKPTGAANWGYVEYFKHADSYVTVKYYSENNNDVFIGRFILGESTWSQSWKKVQYTT